MNAAAVPFERARRELIAARHVPYTALVALFPSRETQLNDRYAASLTALSDDGGDGGQSRERGIAWGTDVARAVLAWRAADAYLDAAGDARGFHVAIEKHIPVGGGLGGFLLAAG